MIKLSIGGFDFTPIFVVNSDGQISSLFSKADKHNVNLKREKKLTPSGDTIVYIDSHRGNVTDVKKDVEAFIKELANEKHNWVQERGFIRDGERAVIFWNREVVS